MSKYKDKIIEIFNEYPEASLGEVARWLGCSKGTVNKYKPKELKAKPFYELTEEEQAAFLEKMRREDAALERMPWDMVKKIRNANGFKLYPIEWMEIAAYFNCRGERVPFRDEEEIESALKELMDSLYDWHLYESCPKCGTGIRIPVWCSPRQYVPMCGCSNFPACDYSVDRAGKPVIGWWTITD